MALLGSGGKEVELAPGVRSEVPEGWAVASSTSKGVELVPEGYENRNRNDLGESLESSRASSEGAYISASESSCDEAAESAAGGMLPDQSSESYSSSGYDTITTESASMAEGEATVAGYPATWDVSYAATAGPWRLPNSTATADYPTYTNTSVLTVCVKGLALSASMMWNANLNEPSDEAPEDEPTAERNASVPEARNEVHEELDRRYEEHLGAVTDLLESAETGGLFSGGRTDLSAIPTSLDAVDAELSNPFGGPLEGFANAPEEAEDYGTTESTSSTSPDATTSASPDSSAPPSSEEDILEEFAREYDEASRDEDWAKTYSMLQETFQQQFTEAEWAEAQRIMREAEGPPPPLESVSVEQNEEMSDVPATVTLTYEDGTVDTILVIVPMVVEDPSDSGVPKRVLIGQEIGEVQAVSSSGQSIEEMEANVEEAAEDYYQAAGLEDWAYTYENLDEETRSGFTEEEWFQKNQWFADNGEVIYNIDSVGRTGTSSEFWGVTLTLTYEDGTSSTRQTYFVYEDEEWKHRFGQEENDLFMPDATFEEFVEAQGSGSSASPEGQQSMPPFPEDTNGSAGEEI